ncbi:hypothetical protein [Laribacter hongkongensis]|uniref:Uncharacterized protein n=1 Tax=Laribacter hongkongensis TaxID=168471 RepID=A0ABD4SUJ3_9NEIS|nr:hypothetical protein [Laribacter hongkongensis]MCG9027471.1 hypothetical protein [Laribacter hongkongensis]
MIELDRPHTTRHHAPVAFNSATGLGGPITSADSRLAAIFTSVYNTTGASFMAGSGGGVLARAGSDVPVRQPCHMPASPLGGEESGSTLTSEATMPSFALRVFRALLSRSHAVSIIRPAADLAEARRMAADLIAQDQRCSVRITAGSRGFDVEVAA